MKKGMKYLLFGLCAGGTVMVLSSSAWAVSGVCSDCHTMHNSQDGVTIVATPQVNLLAVADGCLGCHGGTNVDTANFAAGPYVYDSGITDETTSLAGGNFGWVLPGNGGDAKGHNVSDIAALAADATLATSPGGTEGQVSCADCHGSGGHHSNATGSITAGATAGTSYRFLQHGAGLGVSGYEDPNYEAASGVLSSNLSATTHNQYKGDTAVAATDTISAFCASCHGDFHTTVGVPGAWTRHPTDRDLNGLGGEYALYNVAGVSGRTYSTDIPVGSTNVSAVLGEVVINAGDAIVTCLSCHRAHGSPNDDMLRFAYTMDAHSGTGANTGCFVCHTAKDDVI